MSRPLEIWASPEPTFARTDATTFRDQLAETGHAARPGDIDLLAGLGISATRYPVLWERTAPGDPTALDLAWARPRLERLRRLDVEPIVTLLHHGSGPAWTDLLDDRFPDAFAAYAGAIARALPWIRRWTPINEPLTTARFATLYGSWYPNRRDDASFGRAIVNEALAMLGAMAAIRRHVPGAEFLVTEDLQGFTATDDRVRDYVDHKRERAFLAIELVAGRVVPGHAMHAYLRERCGISVATLERVRRMAVVPDLVGWNYYPNSERLVGRDARNRTTNVEAMTTRPISPLPLLRAAHARLGLPFGFSEVHRAGDESERVAWLDARFADATSLRAEGLPVAMVGAWAAFGMVDWNSLLLRRDGVREDGIFAFAPPNEEPRETRVATRLRELVRGSRAFASV